MRGYIYVEVKGFLVCYFEKMLFVFFEMKFLIGLEFINCDSLDDFREFFVLNILGIGIINMFLYMG